MTESAVGQVIWTGRRWSVWCRGQWASERGDDAGEPSMGLVLYRGVQGSTWGWGQCQSGGRAERLGRWVMKLLSDSGLCLLAGD
jgi:hypothetical protein